MTALDTNVIVRYLVGDNAEHAEAARWLLDGLTPGNPGFICREVVIEVAWVLERSYRFTRTRVAEALMELTASDSLGPVHTNASKMRANSMKPRKRASSLSKREKIRRKPFNRLNKRSTSLRLLYTSLS